MENFDYDLRSIQEARDLARCGEAASKAIAKYTDEQIDAILRSMAKAGEEHALCLGEMAAEETGFGVAMDKAYKNHAASTLLYDQIKGMKTTGILSEDTVTRTIEVAEPVGLIMGIVPSTNPTSTVFFKSMIAIKSGNAIVFSPHPSAAKCTLKATEVMRNAAIAAGAPEGIISCVTMPSMGSTNELMKCKEVSIIIATGGPGMVKAAYSAGKPAIGVGAGNSPAYIEKTADVKHAVRTIMASKTFDYGTICASEQSIICEESNHAEVVAELKAQGGYFMTKEETDKVCSLLFKNGHNMNAKFVGRSPQVIAAAAGIQIPEGTRVLIGKQEGVGEGYPLSYEKLTTVLAFYTVKDWEEACGLSIRLLQNGIGHTMSIHTQDRDKVVKFAAKPASRILVNTGGSQGGTGISTGLPIAFTLGCGTCGGSSVSENVSPKHLINIKTVAYGLKDCSTIVEDDNTFMWKNGNTKTSCSPADFVTSFEKKETAPAASCQSGCDDNEKLAALVKEIVLAMKGQ
ncbi:acetaldehyde dehydrogenase (acetylating) [Lacrimispora sp.]|jgi:acetaldehyde dehydrogenase (acetylating)|uniref:acetaldehyde dehydrogenase (acetylating) n=1 Tax=Lacrimispora sp. TaxID=2719234 RepID=UPI0028A6BC8F|nr:acetaldehyde dehydrogenase (acetylating) [Lacrimispora sp.]